MSASDRPSRQEISDAVTGLGWRLVLGAVYTEVTVSSLAAAGEVAALVVAAVRAGGQGHVSTDIRSDRVGVRLQSAAAATVTDVDIALAQAISSVLTERNVRLAPASVQALEIAVDALDIGAVRPFWQAITGYVDEAGPSDLTDGLIDPAGRGPAIWFQQMDAPRPQRNRIHLDIDVPHDVATTRIAAAIAAGGTLLSDARAPAFWVLADPEGNEACICTWQGSD
ncbi:4a-hydroxytetrahydrobiopterin dehydratase [Mycolicibacterium aromaticivorans JS19b1 = JCM 16368]|uniref:4a-hydroxytetrahydrobiopterin dehydratase n=1 Tax=Mycolicibacterium aromaticivorans JS19b1 = JCM 16368 TaxID=1440774 RepID=A0A064CC61_9MYCO|nr:VOC family protein [Mycolicibacterium aromaticivorans]KDE97935.1 4a-hydroxytetrahydrobiopterin dehydratase [Mycolicibacterium aromaticivorans JS19b1 = JCM 16368]